ncbi:MAG: cyclic nucleotide-binding domain-containing protein [Pseudomonadota bacterium]
MLGLDALVSVANVVYLLSYSVRDILWLRILTVFGATLLMPYYYLQSEPLWAPICWNLVFVAINVFWIVRLLLDRRPVPFNDDERRLYRLAFRNMNERDALKLFRTGTWSHQPPGTVLLTQGQTVNALTLIVDGEVSVEMNGTRVDTLGEGRFLGGIALLHRDTEFVTPVTVRTASPTRIIVWQFDALVTDFAKDNQLQIAMQASIGLEIARFLSTARGELLQKQFPMNP